MFDIITIYHQGSGVLIIKSVADRFGLTNRANVNDEKFFNEILIANCEEGIAMCQLGLAIDKVNTQVEETAKENN